MHTTPSLTSKQSRHGVMTSICRFIDCGLQATTVEDAGKRSVTGISLPAAKSYYYESKTARGQGDRTVGRAPSWYAADPNLIPGDHIASPRLCQE